MIIRFRVRQIAGLRAVALTSGFVAVTLIAPTIAIAQTTLPQVNVDAPNAPAKAPKKAIPARKPAKVEAKQAVAPQLEATDTRNAGPGVSVTPPGAKRTPAAQVTDTPLATQTTGEGIRKNEISSITDLGNTTEPGVDYSSRTDGPAIRGLDGPRVSTVIDGIPIPFLENNARASTATVNVPTNADGGSNTFDFFSLSALDVLRGVDSSRIGSGVLGGAVVLRTLEPEDIITTGNTTGVLAKATYDSRDESFGGGLAVSARSGAVSVLALGSYVTGRETETQGKAETNGATRTAANPADFDQDNLLFKARATNGGHRFGITGERFRRDIDADLITNWNRSTSPTTGFNPGTYFGEEGVERERVSLEYTYQAPMPGMAVSSAFATAYWQDLARNSGAFGTQRNGVSYVRDVDLEQETFGLVGGMTGNLKTGPLNHFWRAGIDLSTFTATQFTTLLPTNAFAGRSQADIPEVDGSKIGIYIEDRLSFAGSRFSLTPGVRVDWHEYEPTASAEFTANSGASTFGLPGTNSNTHVTPKVLATYQATETAELFAQWAAAYRAPTVNELYSNFSNFATGYAQVGNPDLEPETGHGIELGANIGNRDFGVRITAFNNWYRNFILAGDIEPDPAFPQFALGVARFFNVNEVELRGVEMKSHLRLVNGIRLHGGLAYTYGEDGDGNRLATVAPLKAITGIGYETATWGVDLIGIFVGKYNDDFANAATVDTTFDAPAYAIANFTAWWEPAFVKGMRIQGTVRNLFDETYYDALSLRTVNLSSTASQPLEFYSQPGRNFVLSVTQQF